MQINTGKGCHLDAHMVGHAIETLDPAANSVLFIENVGNLVCPAAFDLGEAHKVAVLSVTEGEDKPLKYPDMFAAADIMVLNKSTCCRISISTPALHRQCHAGQSEAADLHRFCPHRRGHGSALCLARSLRRAPRRRGKGRVTHGEPGDHY